MILQYVIITESNAPKGYMLIVDLGLSGELSDSMILDRDLILWVKWVLRTYQLSWLYV